MICRTLENFSGIFGIMNDISDIETGIEGVCSSLAVQFTPTLQKPEGIRVKASEGEVVVFYFEPSATQNLKSSGFPEGGTTWQNRFHPSNSPELSRNLSFCYVIGNNCGPLSNFCYVVYATKG